MSGTNIALIAAAAVVTVAVVVVLLVRACRASAELHKKYGMRVEGTGPFPIPGERKRLERAHREAVEFRAMLDGVARTNACWARTPNVGPPDHPARVFALDADTGEWIDANGWRFPESDLVEVRYIP